MSIHTIFNRTPTIAEDTLEYNLYSSLTTKSDVTALATCIQSFVDSLLPGFLWHRDPFEVKVVEDEVTHAWRLQGRMRVGDCVDDEWCTVWLLKQISEKWDDVVISVFDSDGEFLLIEAADVLPAWIQPSNSENRVWIHRAQLHLVPLGHASPPSKKRKRRKLPGTMEDEETELNTDEDDDYIAPEDAVPLVRDPLMDTRAPSSVERVVWQRISGYPELALQHVHRTGAWLPEDVARALSANPALVQKAVEAFYTRDAIQLRATNRMTRFPPSPSVLRTVTMTRTAYAQLVGQKFFPPRVFGWWSEREGSKEWRKKDIGMKIACGFEMLYQESKSKASISLNSESLDSVKEMLQRDSEYIKYIESLKSAGYFKGELSGSQLWTDLENKAVQKFVEIRRADDASRPSFAQMVNTAISATKDAPLASSVEEEDSDDWLNVDEEKLNGMLHRASEQQPSAMDVSQDDSNGEAGEKRQVDEQAARLKSLADKVEKFVEGEGDLEGARFEDDILSDEKFSDESSDSDDEPQMDPAERQAAMDKLVAPLNPGEYGAMPRSYSKSQKTARESKESGRKAETKPNATKPPMRKPFLPRNDYDGVISDEDTDSDEEEDEEDDERPQVVGEIDIDMDEEQDEFLEFTRQVLGISDDQWGDILKDRMRRGAFVPEGTKIPQKKPAPPMRNSAAVNQEHRAPASGPRPNVNPNLDSFEAVMQAMEDELAKSRGKPKPTSIKPTKTAAKPADVDVKGKGKAKAPVEDEIDESVEMEMDAELRAALNASDESEGSDGEAGMDYNLIKNFLESFKSQAGLSGPVSNLAGRLQPGWQLPRDNA